MAEPARVAASEADLIALARALVAGPPADVRALLRRTRALPPMISTAAARLIGDALAQVWPALWRGSATGTGRPAAPRARFWQDHAPVGLTFSVATLQLLRWVLAGRAREPERDGGAAEALASEMPLTLGDQVMVYLALDATAGMAVQAQLAAQPLVRSAALAWLGFADRLGGPTGCEFDPLCRGAGAIVVEVLAPALARRWRAAELDKRGIAAPEALIALGAAQDSVLGGFMTACDRSGRRDLAGFVIDAAAPLVDRAIAPLPLALDPSATLASRSAARRAAGALLRGVATWAAWDRAHRGVRFIDDDYPTAQRLLARFEAISPAGAARAEAWLTELAALPTVPAGTVDAS